MSIPDWVGICKDVVLSGTAIFASVVGYRGLNNWQRQLSGNAEYQLAKTLLTNVYELRDSLARARSRISYDSTEPNLPEEKLKVLTTDQKRWHALAQSYDKRWEPIPAITAKLDVSLWEAEAVWGPAIVSTVRKLSEKVGTLRWAMEEEIELQDPAARKEVEAEGSDQDYRERRRILFARSKNDDFATKINEVISAVEVELRPHIVGHRRG